MPAKITKMQDMALKMRAPIIGLFDAGGRAHPGGRGGARRLRRGVPPQRRGLRRHPADLGHHGALRGRRRLFARHDGLHLHGAGHELHVRDRPRRREDRDQRDRDGRGPRRRPVHTTRSPRSPTWPSTTTSRRCCRCAGSSTSCPPTTGPALPEWPSFDDVERRERRLDTLVPENPNKPYDMKELIAEGRRRGRLLRDPGRLRPQHRHGLRPHRRPHRRGRGQPADGAGRRARLRRLAQGGALRALLRLFRDPDRHLRRRARLPARHRAGIWRAHQARRQAALRLFAGDGADGHGDHPQGLRRRLRRDGLQARRAPTSTTPGRPRRSP